MEVFSFGWRIGMIHLILGDYRGLPDAKRALLFVASSAWQLLSRSGLLWETRQTMFASYALII